MKTTPFFEQYWQLIKKLDARIEELENIQQKHINCKKRCAACCMNFGIVPIEFFAISQAIGKHKIKNPQSENCKFLQNNECSIYKHRPIICRTQGLANVYFNEENDVWELSLCEQNFTSVADDFFTEEQCLNMSEINETLAEINREFLKANQAKQTLIDVNEL